MPSYNAFTKGSWTLEEDERLRQVLQSMPQNEGSSCRWSEVSNLIDGRSAKQCRERWCYNLDPLIKKAPWSAREDEDLIKAQVKLGNRWAQIALQLPGRTENSVKTRHKSIMRARKRAWTAHEDKLILEMHGKIGCRWDIIAKRLPLRTKNAVKTRYRLLVRGLAEAAPVLGSPEQILGKVALPGPEPTNVLRATECTQPPPTTTLEAARAVKENVKKMIESIKLTLSTKLGNASDSGESSNDDYKSYSSGVLTPSVSPRMSNSIRASNVEHGNMSPMNKKRTANNAGLDAFTFNRNAHTDNDFFNLSSSSSSSNKRHAVTTAVKIEEPSFNAYSCLPQPADDDDHFMSAEFLLDAAVDHYQPTIAPRVGAWSNEDDHLLAPFMESVEFLDMDEPETFNNNTNTSPYYFNAQTAQMPEMSTSAGDAFATAAAYGFKSEEQRLFSFSCY